MSPNSKNVDVPFAAEVVVPDDLAVHVVHFEADMVRFDSILDLGRARDEDILLLVNTAILKIQM